MLFNSVEFIFVYLPAVLLLVAAFRRFGCGKHIPALLLTASVVFYACWNVNFLAIIGLSVLFNFFLARLILARSGTAAGEWLLGLSIAANLAALCYYKYAAFLVSIVTGVSSSFDAGSIVLPLGMSFFTFTQITYLVDAQQRQAKNHGFVDYALFVTYFPHLISGPILHHKDMMPQFDAVRTRGLLASDVALGTGIFAIGLFKKAVLADNVGVHVDEFYGAIARGDAVSLVEAWAGGIAYSLQLYFDFSGYCDMAMGASRMLGVNLPFNFASPYKAASIIDYWRRWHITLTNLITAYIFNPIMLAIARRRQAAKLPGFRRGRAENVGAFFWLVVVPTMIAMTLAGIWHGAGWQFVAFGAVNGAYLVINHGWRTIRGRIPLAESTGVEIRIWGSRVLVIAAVVVSHVLFRAETMEIAARTIGALFGLHASSVFGTDAISVQQLALMAALLALVWFAPGTHEIVAGQVPGPKGVPNEGRTIFGWRPNVAWLLASGVAFGLCTPLLLKPPTQFIYFQF